MEDKSTSEEEFPLDEFKADMDAVADRFSAEIERTRGMEYADGLAIIFNAILIVGSDLGDIIQRYGADPKPFDIRAIFEESWPTRELELGHGRALAVAVAYEDGFRPSICGEKDTPMEAALLVAAKFEGLDLETGPETIRKSIQRFRKKVRATSVFRPDYAELKIHRLDAENEFLRGLPGRPGRPKKAQD